MSLAVVSGLVKFFGPLVAVWWLCSSPVITRAYKRYCTWVSGIGTPMKEKLEAGHAVRLAKLQRDLEDVHLKAVEIYYTQWHVSDFGRPCPLSFLRKSSGYRHTQHRVDNDTVVFFVPGSTVERRWPLTTIDLEK